MIGRAAPQPAVGGFANVEVFLAESAFVIFDLIAVIVAFLVPHPRTWTRRSATGGFIAAIASAAWCLFASPLDPDAVAPTSDDTVTLTIIWLVASLAGIVFCASAEPSARAESR